MIRYSTETPPRTWGRLYCPDDCSPDSRNTPTHVGKTRLQHSTLNSSTETPPRTWGRRGTFQKVADGGGNTPTHVGKTSSFLLRTSPCRKHPHARGEDFLSPAASFILVETPPRTWGRPGRNRGERDVHRNTPTHVGKTGTRWRFYQDTKKHPHARGEDIAGLKDIGEQEETPPRTWGRPPK